MWHTGGYATYDLLPEGPPAEQGAREYVWAMCEITGTRFWFVIAADGSKAHAISSPVSVDIAVPDDFETRGVQVPISTTDSPEG